MFILNEKYEINRNILKCDYIPYSPSEISTMNTVNSQVFINIPREGSVISSLISYLDLTIDVLHAAIKNRYADGNEKRLVNLGPIALFSNHKLTTSSRKHLEDIIHANIVSSMYTLTFTAKYSSKLSVGFDRSRDRRKQELTINKKVKGKYLVRIMLKDVFGFSGHQEKTTYGLGYKLTLTRNVDNSVLKKDNATIVGRIKIISIERYVRHYTSSTSNQAILSKQTSSKTPTEFHYVDRIALLKERNTQKF